MKKTLAIVLTLVIFVSCCSVVFASAEEAEEKPFWLVTYNDSSLEGAGVIFTEKDTAGPWWTHVAFSPIKGTKNAYEITEISEGISEGRAVTLDIPKDGFVYAIHPGIDYPSLGLGAIDYTSNNCSAMIADIQTWVLGDRFVFTNVDSQNFTIAPTTTPNKNWYDDNYICTATYSIYDPNAQSGDEKESDESGNPIPDDADFAIDLQSMIKKTYSGRLIMTVVMTVKDFKPGVAMHGMEAKLSYDASQMTLVNAINKDTSIDCVTLLPYGDDSDFVNMTYLRDEDGVIYISVINAISVEQTLDAEHPMELTFRFELAEDYINTAEGCVTASVSVSDVDGIYVPDGGGNGKDFIGAGATTTATYVDTGEEPEAEPEEKDFGYTIANGEATVTRYLGKGGNVTIPSTLGGYPVTTIGESAFFMTNLTSITIPSGVITIEGGAFNSCERLSRIVIPDSVTELKGHPFFNCANITSITVSNGNPVYYSSGNCLIEKETSVLILGCQTSVIPEGVKSIGDWAFESCTGLTSVTIPWGVTTIREWAFEGCTGLTSVTIPSSVTTIGEYAFHSCMSLTSIVIPESVTELGELPFYRCVGLTSITVSNGNLKYYSSGNCLIEKETGVLVLGCQTSVIPDSATTIGRGAFAGCSKLTSISIPDSITEIGSSAFSGCTGLVNIEIPEAVKTMGANVFYECTSLSDIYCFASEEPSGWDESWNYICKATVHWGYKTQFDPTEPSNPTEPKPEQPSLGDLGGNGKIDVTDYMMLKRAVLGTLKLTDKQNAVADINKDGKINSTDYMLLKRIVLGTYKLR